LRRRQSERRRAREGDRAGNRGPRDGKGPRIRGGGDFLGATAQPIEGGVGNDGIKLSATPAAKLAADVVEAAALLVSSRGEHGVNGVGDMEDSCAEGNLLVAKAGRVADTVVPFVMMQNQRQLALEASRGPQDGSAGDGMLLDDLVLLRGEGAGFGEDGVGDADLPDVVEDGGSPDDVGLANGEVEEPGQTLGVEGHVQGVLLGEGVLGFDRGDQGGNGIELEITELTVRLVQPFFEAVNLG
jgi:hypothetical protein